MRICSIALFVAIAGLAAQSKQCDPIVEDNRLLHGSWKLAAVSEKGKDLPKKEWGTMDCTLTFGEKNTVTWRIESQVFSLTYRLRVVNNSRWMDFTGDDSNPHPCKANLYKVNGEKLKLAYFSGIRIVFHRGRDMLKAEELDRPRSFKDPSATVATYIRIRSNSK